MTLELIHNWRDWWRMWSIRLQVAGLAIIAYLKENPDAAITIWNNLPSDLRAAIPEQHIHWLGYAVLALGLFARLVKQRSLDSTRAGGVGQPQQRDPDVRGSGGGAL